MKRIGYDFDDVLIEPQLSSVNSRGEVDISVKLGKNLKVDFPVIASPMLGIVDANFANEFSKLGGIAVLHRFYERCADISNEISKLHQYTRFGLSVGLNGDFEFLLNYNPDILVIDVANGYTSNVAKFSEKVKSYITTHGLKTLLMSGNVVTPEGVKALRDSGSDMVRVGIGGGGLCSTRNITGIGVPQITALQDCARLTDDVIIVADGGIRNSGDVVKAIVAGADITMAGSIFAKAYESPAKDIIFGMASRRLQEMRYTQVKSVEGIEKAIKKECSLAELVEEMGWGIRSAGTYLNARNLVEIYTHGRFVTTGKGSLKSL